MDRHAMKKYRREPYHSSAALGSFQQAEDITRPPKLVSSSSGCIFSHLFTAGGGLTLCSLSLGLVAIVSRPLMFNSEAWGQWVLLFFPAVISCAVLRGCWLLPYGVKVIKGFSYTHSEAHLRHLYTIVSKTKVEGDYGNQSPTPIVITDNIRRGEDFHLWSFIASHCCLVK
ncbi:hypothetical protein XENOCAPTIV_014461, partial [Xenoophorus captivus]